MIPKKIHYCWFGGNPLPPKAQKCIASWRKFFPDYEIIEWNEDNYDVQKNQYIRQAYQAKKYAFVSDYARFDILYAHGGVYFDTDVEVIKSFDDILDKGAFMGCEIDGGQDGELLVAPGLGMAAEPNHPVYKKIIAYYDHQDFFNEDGSINTLTVVRRTTGVLKECGLLNHGGMQTVQGITIYPKEYFNPLNNNTGKLECTANTHTIHWYDQSWLSPAERLKSKITRPFHRIFGDDCFRVLKRILGKNKDEQ